MVADTRITQSMGQKFIYFFLEAFAGTKMKPHLEEFESQ